MTPQDKSAPRQWTLAGGSVYEKGKAPSGYLSTAKIDVIEYSAYATLQAECERLKELLEYETNHANGMKYAFDQVSAKRDQWRQMAEEMAGALEWANITIKYVLQNELLNNNVDIRRMISGSDDAYQALAKFAKLKEQMK